MDHKYAILSDIKSQLLALSSSDIKKLMLNIITRGGKYAEFTKTQHRDKEFARKLGWANLENALSYLVDLRTK